MDVDICFYAVYGMQVDIVFMPYFLFCQTQEVIIVFKSPDHFIILHLATACLLSNTLRIVASNIIIFICALEYIHAENHVQNRIIY